MKVPTSKKFLFIAASIIMIFIYASCDGIFPSQTKDNLPADHNSSYGGYLHKGGNRETEIDDCKHCHGNDLKGQLYNYNGTYVVTQSCYQCHGTVWERNNGGNGK
jgi:hypothetical protein